MPWPWLVLLPLETTIRVIVNWSSHLKFVMHLQQSHVNPFNITYLIGIFEYYIGHFRILKITIANSFQSFWRRRSVTNEAKKVIGGIKPLSLCFQFPVKSRITSRSTEAVASLLLSRRPHNLSTCCLSRFAFDLALASGLQLFFAAESQSQRTRTPPLFHIYHHTQVRSSQSSPLLANLTTQRRSIAHHATKINVGRKISCSSAL